MSSEHKGRDPSESSEINKYSNPALLDLPRSFALLGSHTGSIDVHKIGPNPKASDPKYAERHVFMSFHGFRRHHIRPEQIRPHQNKTVFSSVIGAAIAGQSFCPLWRLAPINNPDPSKRDIILGVRTKFIPDFSSLKRTLEEVRGETTPESGYAFHKLNEISPEVLTYKKLPLFFALTKILGNVDIPARNVGHHGDELKHPDKPFFMSDVDQCGKYWPLSRLEIASPLALNIPQIQGEIIMADPYHPLLLYGPKCYDREQKIFEECAEKIAKHEPACDQHFQALFASTLLPSDWIESIPQKYLLNDDDEEDDDEEDKEDEEDEEDEDNNSGIVALFKKHQTKINGLIQSTPEFLAAFSHKEKREAWLQEALFHFARLNIQEYRTSSGIPINLNQVIEKFNDFCVGLSPAIPALSHGESERFIAEAKAAAGKDFLKDKAIQYLSKLENLGKIKKIEGLPKHAAKIIQLLNTSGANPNWEEIKKELATAIKAKSFNRHPRTQAAYVKLFNHIGRILRELEPALASSETATTTPRSSFAVHAPHDTSVSAPSGGAGGPGRESLTGP
jgi:hypothetical protein